MPRTKLTPQSRRAVVLAVLRDRRRAEDVAPEHGISPTRVYQLVAEAKTNAGAEHEFWGEVLRLTKPAA